ncbi:MAG: Fic family protein [Microgenomates group bacterium]
MFKPVFTISNNLLTYISRIESAKALIDNAPLVPAWEAKFRDEAFTKSVHFGTKIEGNDLSQSQAEQVARLTATSDTEEVVRKTGIMARERDIQEVINYRNVLSWIDSQKPSSLESVFTIDTMRTLHKLTVNRLVEEHYSGAYRDKQVIVKSATSGAVVFRPPVSIEIPYLIEDFFAWATSAEAERLHPIFVAAIAHYQLVYVHPFIEGNGRTARAMASLLLFLKDYDFKKFFSIEQYFDSDVEAYYQALLSVQQNEQQDMTYWLEYFCYGVAIEVDKVKDQVTKLSKDLKLKKQLGQQVALSERQIIMLELFQNLENVTSDDMQSALPNISVDTILRDVKDLIEKGVIKKLGVTKGVRYQLVE